MVETRLRFVAPGCGLAEIPRLPIIASVRFVTLNGETDLHRGLWDGPIRVGHPAVATILARALNWICRRMGW